MPQYVSLAQQGFFEPYQLLGQGLARYQDRKDHKAERQQDVSFREGVHRDTMSQQGIENARQSKLDAINMPIGQLNLQQLQEQEKMRQGMLNFNAAQVKAPKPVLPPGAQGPPELGQIDLHTPFYDQTPEAQQAVVAAGQKAGLPPLDTIHLFGQQQAAMTGVPSFPKAPPGMAPFEADLGGVKFHAAPPTTPPTIIHKDGRDWVVDPKTGQWEAAPHVPPSKDMSQQELGRLESIDQSERDLNHIEDQFKNFSQTGPVMGRLQHLNPLGIGDRSVLEQAVNAAVPNLARGVFREVGVLTDADVKRYAQQFPTLNDSPDTRARKMTLLRQRLQESRAASLDMLRRAGRATEGFESLGKVPLDSSVKVQPPGSPNLPKFQSEAEARAAGITAPAPGQPAALVFDPSTGRFRPWAP